MRDFYWFVFFSIPENIDTTYETEWSEPRLFSLPSLASNAFSAQQKHSHTKPMERSCLHHGSLSAKKETKEGTIFAGLP